MRDKAFYVLFLSFFVGIFAGSFLYLSIAAIGASIVVAFACLAYARPKGVALFLIGGFISACFGLVRIEASKLREHPLDASVGQKVFLRGVLCDEPQVKATAQKLCVAPDGSDDRILATVPRYPEYSYGETIFLSGKLQSPENFTAYEGGPTFDYVSYLAKDDIRYVMPLAYASSTGEIRANPVVATLFATKRAFLSSIQSLMPEPYASLMAGILLGDKSALPEDVALAFKRSGLTHILVLSGSNVSVVANSLIGMLRALPRVLGESLGALGIVAFAVMTGGGSTTIRASAMALICILASRAGRPYAIVRALVIAAFLMLVQNPRILAFDISFQLSFLATLALIFVSPLVSDWLPWIPERFGLRDVVAASLATQIFTLPFILSTMGEVSVISLAPNILVLPLVPWSMFLGFVVGALGVLSPFIAIPFAFAADSVLWYMTSVVSFFSAAPFATVRFSIGHWTLFGIYFLYTILLVRMHRRRAILTSS